MKRLKRVVSMLTIATLLANSSHSACGQEILEYRTVSNRKTAENIKIEQTISGPLTYNVFRQSGTVNLKLQNSAKTDLTYTIVDGEDIASLSTVTGEISFSGNGEVILKAEAKETDKYQSVTSYIAISCNKHQFESGIENASFTYNGKSHPFNYNSITGAKSCTPFYAAAITNTLTWTEEAPKNSGSYLVKLNLTTISGVETVKFVTLDIKKKVLKISGFGVEKKEWDGSDTAVLSGTLKGVVDGDSVSLTMPIIKFVSSDAGKNKKIKIVQGELGLTGNDVSQYTLDDYSLENLKGTINPKIITVTAVSRVITKGEAFLPLTYTVEGANFDAVDGIRASCNVNADSPPGEYMIRIVGNPSNKNYKIKRVAGTYTILDSGSSTSGINNDLDYDTDSEDDRNDDLYSFPTTSPTPTPKPSYVFEMTPYNLSQVLVFDGISKIDDSFDQKELLVSYWLTKDSVVSSNDSGVKLSLNKKNWQRKLKIDTTTRESVIESEEGVCSVSKNLTFFARYNGTICKIIVKSFVCDKEKPLISVDGIRSVSNRSSIEEGITQNESFTFSVDSVYGIAGKKTLAYKYVSDSSTIDVDSQWNLVKQNQITIDRDFSGYLSIKAEDVLGNCTVVYTDKIKIDASAPSVTGIENGGEYEGTVLYSVTDLSGVASVTVDGIMVETDGEIHGGGLHTMTVTDNNGNSQSITFRCSDTNFVTGVLQSIKALFGGV